MRDMLKCEDILRKSKLESYSEFYMALCCAAEADRLGYIFDMSNIRIDLSLLSKNEVNYFRYLRDSGVIYVNGNKEINPEEFKGTVNPKELRLYMDMNIITEMEDYIVDIRNNCYFWSEELFHVYRDRNAPSYMQDINNIPSILMHISAYLIVDMYLGLLPERRIHYKFDIMGSMNGYRFINLYSCSSTMDWFNKLLYLDIQDTTVDLDYDLFINNSIVAGRNKLWPINDKINFMKKYSMVEGAVCILYERKGVTLGSGVGTESYGKIDLPRIAIIKEVTCNSVILSTCVLKETKEEVIADFPKQSYEARQIMSDVLKFDMRSRCHEREFSLSNLGINTYFYNETYLLCNIDNQETTCEKVTIDGQTVDVFMSNIDSIYWLLCQYGIDFNKELYKSMYSPEKDLLWDTVGEQPEVDVDILLSPFDFDAYDEESEDIL